MIISLTVMQQKLVLVKLISHWALRTVIGFMICFSHMETLKKALKLLAVFFCFKDVHGNGWRGVLIGIDGHHTGKKYQIHTSGIGETKDKAVKTQGNCGFVYGMKLSINAVRVFCYERSEKDLNSLFTGRYASSCMNITPSFLSVACRLMMTMIISFDW